MSELNMDTPASWCFCTDSGNGVTVICAPHKEIAHLHAEVERLQTKQDDELGMRIELCERVVEQGNRIRSLECERDEALARLEQLEHRLYRHDSKTGEISLVECEACKEALAQVAVLASSLERFVAGFAGHPVTAGLFLKPEYEARARALLEVAEAAQLKRNTILHGEGWWVAVPKEDFDALRNALARWKGELDT